MTQYDDYDYHYHIHYHYHYHHHYQHNHHNPQDSFHATPAAPTNTASDPVEPKVTNQEDCKSTNQVDSQCTDQVEPKPNDAAEPVNSSPTVTGPDSAATVNGTESKQEDEDEPEVPLQENAEPVNTLTAKDIEELTLIIFLFLIAVIGLLVTIFY